MLWAQEKHKTYEFIKDFLIQSDHCVFLFFLLLLYTFVDISAHSEDKRCG